MKKIALLLMLLPMLASAHVSGNAYQIGIVERIEINTQLLVVVFTV